MPRSLVFALFIIFNPCLGQVTPKSFDMDTRSQVDFSDTQALLSIRHVVIDSAYLAFKPIYDLPKDIELLVNLESIRFSVSEKANISLIFERLTKFKRLKELVISCNNFNINYIHDKNVCQCLTKIPKSINRMSSLEKLTLSGNLISQLPFEIGSLPNLKFIYLFRNKFTEFPTELFYLTNLKEIGLDNNYIQNVPIEICNMKELESFSVGENSLKELPDCILQMQNLKKLEISDNFISQELLKKYRQTSEHLFLKISEKQYNLDSYPRINRENSN